MIELKVGRLYRDRYNNQWRILHEDRGFTYSFVARKVGVAVTDETYTANGRWSNYVQAGCDLIEEL